MKVTRLGYPRPVMSLASVLSGGSSGQVPVANGSNGVEWTEVVQRISSNGSNYALGPFVNFASGSNVILAVSSNTINIASIGSGSGSLTIKDEGTPLATDATSLDFVGAGVVASGSGAAKTITIAGVSGGAFPLGLAAPDTIPASPGAEDQEFEGTADTLPTDYAWVAEPTDWSINSDYPSWMVWERAANVTTEYKLRISNFAMDATSGLWVKMGVGTHNSASSQWEWIIYDSASSDGYGAGVHNGNVWLARDSNAGTLANRGTITADGVKGDHLIIGVVRVSNTWTTYVSHDGLFFQNIQQPDTRSFTVARLEFRWSSDNGGGSFMSRAGVDWIRYRADNLFPRP